MHHYEETRAFRIQLTKQNFTPVVSTLYKKRWIKVPRNMLSIKKSYFFLRWFICSCMVETTPNITRHDWIKYDEITHDCPHTCSRTFSLQRNKGFLFFCRYSIYQLYGKSLLDYIPYCSEKVLFILLKKFNEEILSLDLKTKVSKWFFFQTIFFSTNFSPRHLKCP